MLERAVNPINKIRDTACASNKYATFLKHNVMTIFVILKSGTRGGGGSFLPSYQVLFCCCCCSFLVRSGLNAVWFLVNSHYKRLCASFCTFETVQEIKKNRMICIFKIWYKMSNKNGNCYLVLLILSPELKFILTHLHVCFYFIFISICKDIYVFAYPYACLSR